MPRLPDALDAALGWHGSQTRKDGSPYVGHLLQVAGLVLEHGGSEVAAMAALLHDVVEDTDATLADVRSQFGDDVADIVDDCTDSIELARGPETWRARKEGYLAHIPAASTDAALVSACDTLHNLRSRAHADLGGFNATDEERLWFYREVVATLSARGDIPAALLEELRSLIHRASG